jgi:hypothetical protein
MQTVADALSLLANIVMAWNTAQMQTVLDRWAQPRQVVPPELIGRIAPTRLEGINLRGIFRFPIHRALQTGAWRQSVTAAMPTPLRPLVAVFIGFMDMLTGLGISRERPRYLRSDAPPAMAPETLLVWKGRLGHPLLVSDQPEDAALAALQRRSLIVAGIGAALLLLVVVSAFE